MSPSLKRFVLGSCLLAALLMAYFASRPPAPPALTNRATLETSSQPLPSSNPKPSPTSVVIAHALTYRQRFAAVDSITNALSTADSHRLISLIATPIPENEMHMHAALANGILHKLRQHGDRSTPWHRTLIQTFQIQTAHSVIRDYVLQHLATWHEELIKEAGAATERGEIIAVMWAATEEAGPTIPGTALLSLNYLSSIDNTIDLERLRQTAIKLARAADTDSSVRATALQICSLRGDSAALDIARDVQKSQHDVALRIAALAVLGQMGESADREVLLTVAESESPPEVKRAAAAALRTFTNAHAQEAL